jgi:hypothetical protein
MAERPIRRTSGEFRREAMARKVGARSLPSTLVESHKSISDEPCLFGNLSHHQPSPPLRGEHEAQSSAPPSRISSKREAASRWAPSVLCVLTVRVRRYLTFAGTQDARPLPETPGLPPLAPSKFLPGRPRAFGGIKSPLTPTRTKLDFLSSQTFLVQRSSTARHN